MENHEIYLFVRVRGKVAGPFDFEKLVTLARKGQLSRMHEVSTDQMSWQRAGTSYPQIWEGWTVTAPAPQPEEVAVIDQTGDAEQPMVIDGAVPSPDDGSLWHYTKAGEEQSPIPFDQLKHLFSLGELTGNEDVWTEGMTDWRKASEMPALASVINSQQQVPVGGGAQSQIVTQPTSTRTVTRSKEGVSGGLIAAGYICAFLFTCVGFILGIVILSKGDGANGAAVLVISILMSFMSFFVIFPLMMGIIAGIAGG